MLDVARLFYLNSSGAVVLLSVQQQQSDGAVPTLPQAQKQIQRCPLYFSWMTCSVRAEP